MSVILHKGSMVQGSVEKGDVQREAILDLAIQATNAMEVKRG